VGWDDYLEGAAKREDQVPWKARRHLFNADDLRESFPEYADEIALNYQIVTDEERVDMAPANDMSAGRGDGDDRAVVWEIWCKRTRERIYVAEGFPKILQATPDPYRLQDFFPCTPPLYAVRTTGTRTPVALFTQYKDQADELERLTTRSNRLMEAMKYCGVYGAPGGETGEDALKDISSLRDGEFIPYKGYAALMQGGGLEKAFLTRDLTPIGAALQAVEEKIATTVQRIYELTGIADIVRGQTDPDETYGAQKLKAQFGSQRSSRRQRMVQRFVRSAYRLKAEVIAEHYSREQLEVMTGIQMPLKADQDRIKMQIQQFQAATQAAQHQTAIGAQTPFAATPLPPPTPPSPDEQAQMAETLQAVPWEDISDILRTDTRRLFIVDVETDDTAVVDATAVKQDALEFLKVFFETLSGIMPAVKAQPVLLPLAKELVMFTVDAFKVGQAFEDAIEDTFDKLAKEPPAPQGAAADPKVQAAIELDKAKLQTEQQRQQAAVAKHQQDAHRFQVELQQQAMQGQQDQERHQAEMQERHEKLNFMREEMTMKKSEMELNLRAKRSEGSK
jgi:hypothetical protein